MLRIHHEKSLSIRSMGISKLKHIQIPIMQRDWGDRKSTSNYYTYVGENLVTWKSKKQNIATKSSAQSEYRSMVYTACEMMWLRSFMTELRFPDRSPMLIYCDNQTTIYIANNPTFYKHTKHIELDCHYICYDEWLHIYSFHFSLWAACKYIY